MSDLMQGAVPAGPRQLVRKLSSAATPVYSICTMVTDWTEYGEFLASFRQGGFGEADCEILTLDNSNGNVADAYVAVNEFLQAALGTYVILVHQDILLIEHGRAQLDKVIAELTALDPKWGVCGNSGYTDDGWPVICISDPYADPNIVGAPFPARVVALDENLLVVRRECNLAVSGDLTGFHHYGPDLCTIADILGWNAYVVEFLLRHKSPGSINDSYYRSRQAIAEKYRRALRPRWVHVATRIPYFIAGRRSEALLARGMRFVQKRLGLAPRYRDLDDPAKRARRDARKRP